MLFNLGKGERWEGTVPGNPAYNVPCLLPGWGTGVSVFTRRSKAGQGRPWWSGFLGLGLGWGTQPVRTPTVLHKTMPNHYSSLGSVCLSWGWEEGCKVCPVPQVGQAGTVQHAPLCLPPPECRSVWELMGVRVGQLGWAAGRQGVNWGAQSASMGVLLSF